MIEKEFVPYQESLELKALGFNETCFTYYIPNSKRIDTIFQNNFKLEDYNSKTNTIYKNGIISTPIFSQAFRWFREKYEYNSFIRGRKSMGFDYTLSDVPTNLSKKDIFQSPHIYETYEEAELACLRKLIEIVKNQSN